MLSLLKTLYIKFEDYRGPRLYRLLLIIVVIFFPVGIFLGYVTNNLLNKSENISNTEVNSLIPTSEKYYEGRIVYIDPNFYPQDKITYILQNAEGKEVILLSAKDQKLQVAEGNFARLYGTINKTKDGKKDVLMVDKVMITNK